jgi:hypothetical protein
MAERNIVGALITSALNGGSLHVIKEIKIKFN